MGLFPMVSFIVVIAAIWFYAYKKSRIVDNDSSEGFFLGGRSLTGLTIAGTIIMTNLSTEQIVGQNGQSYVAGMEVMAWEVTSAVTCVLLAFVFLPRYLKYGVNTISDFIEIRYDTHTKKIVSLLFIVTYMIAFLPVVLYSGALAFNQIFNIDEILGVDALVAITIIAGFIGIVGLLYLLIGGMRLSAYSDTIYGFGLIIGGLSIPIIGLTILGDGNFIGGIETIIESTPEKLNAFGAADSKMVPWPTLFTGMFFNNLFFWCTNQMIIQKTLAGRDLKEGQKGALYVGFFKIFGALFLVFPGIIAYNMFGDSINPPDNAYPFLINAVLPEWATGLFGAVLFGAILSSFVGALNATATLFTLDFYEPMLKKRANLETAATSEENLSQSEIDKDIIDKKVTKIGKFITLIVALVSIIVAPLISFAPSGLYAFCQSFNGIYSMPLLVLILAGFFSKNVTAFGAKVTIGLHIILYALSKVLLSEIHYLYVFGVLFFVDLFIIWIIGKTKLQEQGFDFEKDLNKVDLTPWKNGKLIGVLVIVTMIAMYLVFSPLGIAK